MSQDPSYVPSNKFKIENVILEKSKSKGIIRTTIKYKYRTGVIKNLILTTPSDCYVRCSGVKEEFFTRDEIKTSTGKHTCTLILDPDAKVNHEFFECLEEIEDKIRRTTGKEVRSPTEITDDNKCLVYTKLIEGKNGIIYTKIYDKDKDLQPLTLGSCTVQPAITMSYPDNDTGKINLKFSLSSLLVHKVSTRMLLDKDLSE